jgi:hypothetical protein
VHLVLYVPNQIFDTSNKFSPAPLLYAFIIYNSFQLSILVKSFLKTVTLVRNATAGFWTQDSAIPIRLGNHKFEGFVLLATPLLRAYLCGQCVSVCDKG